jgi:hypothetical protein
LVHLVGLGPVVRQRRAVGGGQGAGLDLMPQPQQVRAAEAQFAGQLRGGCPLGNTAEDREDRRRAEVCPLPGGAGEHVEHPAAAFAAVVDDRGIGATAVDVEAVAGGASGAGQPLGMEQVQ